MITRPLQFVRRGQTVTLHQVPPDRTLLELLREDLQCSDTKEGCNEGDCGACTVVLGQADGDRIQYRAVNSCIRLAHSIQGQALWTAQDLLGPDGSLHPAQQALVQCHGSQCGFCTPGFVMSLFGMYQNHVAQGRPITRALAQQDLSGNLCRCTGYRPILDAAQTMAELPRVSVDEAETLQKLKHLSQAGKGLEADFIYADLTNAYTPSFGLMGHESLIMQQTCPNWHRHIRGKIQILTRFEIKSSLCQAIFPQRIKGATLTNPDGSSVAGSEQFDGAIAHNTAPGAGHLFPFDGRECHRITVSGFTTDKKLFADHLQRL